MGWKGKLLIKSGSWLSQNLLARNPSQVMSDKLFFHLKCAKAWLYYSLEPTLATTFSGTAVGDGGTKLSFLGYDKSSDLSLDGEQGIGIQLVVIIHLVTPWFKDST